MSVLAHTLAAPLGGPDAEGAVAAVVDHVGAAISRLPAQFRKPKIEALLAALVRPAATIETALYQMLTERGLDRAVGAQLDKIGSIVGQERAGAEDGVYRQLCRARIATNRSNGTTEALIKIANLILLDEGARIVVDTVGVAAVEVRIENLDVNDEQAETLIAFLRKGVSAGVRLELITSPDFDNAFTTPVNFFVTGGGASGQTFVQTEYVDGDGRDLDATVPLTGSILLDNTLTTQETRAYTSRTIAGNVVTFTVSVAFGSTHVGGGLVELDTGLGWGTSAGPGVPVLVPYTDVGSIGGRLADARE